MQQVQYITKRRNIVLLKQIKRYCDYLFDKYYQRFVLYCIEYKTKQAHIVVYILLRFVSRVSLIQDLRKQTFNIILPISGSFSLVGGILSPVADKIIYIVLNYMLKD